MSTMLSMCPIYGLGDVVYTGEGNNVISIGSTINNYKVTEDSERVTFGFYNWATGPNTLLEEVEKIPLLSNIRHFLQEALPQMITMVDGTLETSTTQLGRVTFSGIILMLFT